METSGQTSSAIFQTVDNNHGSAADNHGQTGLPNQSPSQAMTLSADPRVHHPTTVQVQPMFLSDSEISPISPAKGLVTPLRSAYRYKRSLDKTSPDSRPERRPGGDGGQRSRSPNLGFNPPTGPVRMDEAYMAEMIKSMNGMAQAIVELNKRNQALEHEWSRWNQWTSDNALRLIQIEGRINEDANKGRTFAIDKCKEIENYLADKKFEERIDRLDEMVAGHNYYMDHLYQVKPAEGYTIKTGFEAIAQQVVEIKQKMALNEQIFNQVAAGAVQTDIVVTQISSALEGARADTQKQFDDIRSELSLKITEVHDSVGGIRAELSGVPTAFPPGWERPARHPTQQPPQFCGNFVGAYGGYGGCGDSHGGGQPQGPHYHGAGVGVGAGGAPHSHGAGSSMGAGGAPHYRGAGGGSGPGGAQQWTNAGASAQSEGKCHCLHVDKLQQDMATVLARTARTPLLAPQGGGNGTSEPYAPGPSHAETSERDSPSDSTTKLPLVLGFLGTSLASGRIFDDKISIHEDFRFNGHKNGHAWRSKTERYLITRVPALSQILRWAEREDSPISFERLRAATGNGLCTYDRDGTATDQTEALNTALWGFLGNCITGEADVMYKQASQCNGVDAWRRIVRFIDSGRSIRLEQLRQEVRHIRGFPIKNLEGVTVGIASFENKIKEFIDAGGRPPSDEEMKSDLNFLLPHELSDYLTVRVTDTTQTYESFRDHAVQACAQLLMRKKRLPVNNINDEPPAAESDHTSEGFDQANDIDDLDQRYVAAVNRINGRGRAGGAGGAQRRQQPRNGPRPTTGSRPTTGDQNPKKCQNCGGSHSIADCPKPIVDRAQRPCWNCDKVGHLGRDCPQKKKSPLRAVSEQNSDNVRVVNGVPMPCWNLNDDDSYTDVRGFKTIKRSQPAFPRATRVTLGMHLSNKFANLESSENDENPISAVSEQSRCSCTEMRATPPSPKAQKAERELQKNRALLRDNDKAIAELAASLAESTIYDVSGERLGKPCKASCGCMGACDDNASLKWDASGNVIRRWATTAQTGLGSNSLPPLTSLSVAKPEEPQLAAEEPRNAAQSAKSVTWAAFEYNEAMFPSLRTEVNQQLNDIEQLLILEEQDDLNAVQEKTRIRVTMDSGAVTHVIHPRALPAGVNVVPNTTGKHFSGASGDTIERFGDCRAQLTTAGGGEIDCGWDLAEVSRPLHAVSKITGSIDEAKHDVLFNNRTCIVVPPGIVDHVLKYMKPIAEYPRQGNLYQAEMTMAPFGRQGS